MSAAMLRHDKGAMLVELLTTKSQPRSSLNRSDHPQGRSGSLRRSRNSPSSLPSVAAEHELSTLLGTTSPEHDIAPQPGNSALPGAPQTRPQSPSVTTQSCSDNQQPETAPQAPSFPPKNSLRAQNHTTNANLSCNDTHLNSRIPTNKVESTSDPNQQSDRNNNGNEPPGSDSSAHETCSDHQSQSGLRGEPRTKNRDQDKIGWVGDEKSEHTGGLSVAVEKHALVPELRAFEDVLKEGAQLSHHRGHMVVTDSEEERTDSSHVQKVQTDSQIEAAEKCDVRSSSSQSEEEEGRGEKVIVWCVTGVCEVAGDLAHSNNTRAQPEEQPRLDNQGGTNGSSSAPANHPPSEPANEKPVPVPISSQPVPVSRGDDPSHPASSPRWHPAGPASANEGPTLTAGASEEAEGAANQEEDAEDSTNDKRETLRMQLTDSGSRNQTASCQTATEAASSTSEKAESSKQSTKNPPTTKTRPAGMRPATSKSRPVRTLTNSENQGMRRVVPISRTRCPEKPPGNHRGASNLNSPSLRRGERPSTAPSSRRPSKTPDPKDSKDPKVSGTQASVQEQNRDLQRQPSIRKALTKAKVQPEEKMCRSTLRALTQGGGGGSISAPNTPLHKATSSSLLPSFAQSTASSSFRQTCTNGSSSSPKSSPRTISSSSVAPLGASSPLTRTGSLRVSWSSSQSSLPSRSKSVRAPPRSPLHDSLAPPTGQRRNDSGSFSKSAHSRDSGKSSRPSWR